MKKLASIAEEVPHVKEAIEHYIHCAEKEIKNCENKIKELNVAVQISKERLERINDQKRNSI